MVGNELGRGNLEQGKKYGKQLCKLAIISGVVSGIVLIALTPLVLKVMPMSEQAQEYLKWMIVLCGCYMVGKAFNTVTIAGIFSAGGDAKFGLVCDTVTMWAVTVPLGLMAAFWWKLPVIFVFLIVNSDEIIKMPVVMRHYRKYKWVKNLTRDNLGNEQPESV